MRTDGHRQRHPYAGQLLPRARRRRGAGRSARGARGRPPRPRCLGLRPGQPPAARTWAAWRDHTTIDPVVADLQRRIDAADHLVLVHPVWWETAPAVMKGFIDKVLVPGWAYEDGAFGGPSRADVSSGSSASRWPPRCRTPGLPTGGSSVHCAEGVGARGVAEDGRAGAMGEPPARGRGVAAAAGAVARAHGGPGSPACGWHPATKALVPVV